MTLLIALSTLNLPLMLKSRFYRTGDTVILAKGSVEMTVLKYQNKLAKALNKHMVCVTWKVEGIIKMATYDEDELKCVKRYKGL